MIKIKNYQNIKILINKKHLRIALLSLAGMVGLSLICFGSYSAVYAKKILANQYIGDVNFAGKNKSSAKDILQSETKDFLGADVLLKYTDKDGKNKTYTVKPSDLGLQYNVDGTVDELWHYGRSGNIAESFWQQLKSVFKKNKTAAVYSINEDSLNQKISSIASELDDPEKDFSLVYQDGKFSLATERKEGSRIDQAEIKSGIKAQISKIKNEEIVFAAKAYKPQIDQKKAEKSLADANGILSAGPLTLQTEDQKYTADTRTIASFISSRPNGDNLEIIFNEDKIKTFVQNLAKSINVTPQNAALTISGGKAVVFSASRKGKTLDAVQTVVDIENALFARIPYKNSVASPAVVDLKVDIQNPDISEDQINNLGIVELVASGTTDFKSSPTNRIHNITIGMNSINGSLIKPGEEFSTLKKIGAVDAASGYLPELVIKNNQTVSDYGGGLCQVSTTLFRAAMNAGLKITERYNHSYRVSYYEPPVGMDATIYDPAPDFKFVNNYGSYLLIQGHISGTKITFEIYGTKDNRKISISDPTTYDPVPAPAKEMIPSDTLPAGQSQQVQKAHDGVTASFTYHVEKDGKVLQNTTFVSKYVALPERWLVGQAPVSTPSPDASNQPAPATDPSPAPAPETTEAAPST